MNSDEMLDDKEILVFEYFKETFENIKAGVKLFFEYPIYKLFRGGK